MKKKPILQYKKPTNNMKRLFLATALIMHFISYAQQKPNIIIIMADDLGYSDLGCFGGEINTPQFFEAPQLRR